MRVVLTGAGSGGHIFPLVAVADELRNQDQGMELLYIGTYGQMRDVAETAMGAEGIPVKNVMTGKMRRYFSAQYFLDFFRIPLGVLQSLWHLLVYMPDAVFSKGGYASVPIVFAAWLYRIPVLTHESDAIPGWANRINGKFSYYIGLSFEKTKKYFNHHKTLITGNPVRPEMMQGDKERSLKRWKFDSGLPVVLVLGGSQGSRAINTALVRVLPELTKFAQVLHVTGKTLHAETLRHAKEIGFRGDHDKYHAVPFLDRTEMADAYALAKLVISRSGANTISELAGNKQVVIFIPIENSANDHQRMNAFDIAKVGGAVVLGERNVGQHILLTKIEKLLRSATLREQFQNNIAEFYHPDASKVIVNGIMQMTK